MLASQPPHTVAGRLYRPFIQPYRTPEEQHAADVLRLLKIEDLGELGTLLHAPHRPRLLADMIDDTYKMRSPADFCADIYRIALKNDENGAGPMLQFSDPVGVQYIYDLSEYPKGETD